MENKRGFIAIIVLDLLVFISMVIGISLTIFDVRFMVDLPRLSSQSIFMTFTGLSNVFIGLVCLGCAIYRIIKKEITLPAYLLLIKIIALADITITFVITATYLAPSIGSSWWRLYINNNLFNHFSTSLSLKLFLIVLAVLYYTKNMAFRLPPPDVSATAAPPRLRAECARRRISAPGGASAPRRAGQCERRAPCRWPRRRRGSRRPQATAGPICRAG